MERIYNYVECTYHDDNGFWCVDAWKTDNDDEEGKVIALINDEGGVYRIDDIDEYAKEVIDEKVNEIKSDKGLIRFFEDIYSDKSRCEVAVRMLGDDMFIKLFGWKRVFREGIGDGITNGVKVVVYDIDDVPTYNSYSVFDIDEEWKEMPEL